MNVDNYNRDDYSALSELIDNYGNPRMILYPAVTEKINERKEERQNHYMNEYQFHYPDNVLVMVYNLSELLKRKLLNH